MAETKRSAVLLAMAIQARDEARREVEMYDNIICTLEAALSASPSAAQPPIADRSPRQSTNGSQKRFEPAVAATVEATRTFLETLGRPAKISEIYAELLRRNVPVCGQSPKRTLDARLRYSGVFKVVPGQGWWVVDRPSPGQSDQAATSDPAERPSESAFRGGDL